MWLHVTILCILFPVLRSPTLVLAPGNLSSSITPQLSTWNHSRHLPISHECYHQMDPPSIIEIIVLFYQADLKYLWAAYRAHC